MPSFHPRVDAYIENAAPFAQPILEHLRRVIHAACPEVVETVKWSMPHFEYRGNLCGMAAFKAHATFGFWLDELVLGGRGAGSRESGATTKPEEAMGQFGRLTSVADLPSEAVLRKLIEKAMGLNEAGVKRVVARSNKPKPAARIPADLAAALRKNAPARQTWEGFSPSHRREYIEWLVEAKRPETRERRLATTLAQLAAGKSRHWKYQR